MADRVLIIDNDPVSSLSMIQHLEQLNYIVSSVDDAHKAISLSGALPPKIVLINMSLEGLDAVNFTKSLRALSGCEDTIVIGLTTTHDSNAIGPSASIACDDHIKKPVDINLLKNKLCSNTYSQSRVTQYTKIA